MQMYVHKRVTVFLIVIAVYGMYLTYEKTRLQSLYALYLPRQQETQSQFNSSQFYTDDTRKMPATLESSFNRAIDENKRFVNNEGQFETNSETENEVGIESEYEIQTITNYYTKQRSIMSKSNQQTVEMFKVNLKRKEVQYTYKHDMKTILWYDTHQQSMVGHSTIVNFQNCEYQNCQYRYVITNKDIKPKQPFDADAVLVQSKAIFTLSPPPRKDRNQVFVLGVRDAFPRVRSVVRWKTAQHWTSLFNWTMTYRLDSDILYQYANVIERQYSTNMSIKDHQVELQNNKNISTKDYERIFLEKSGEAVWFVSHCKTKSEREDYVRELQKVINVKIYGFCGQKAPCPKGDASCFEQLAMKYKFYLAFENTFYEDYVTEKVYHWFNKDVIVVVRGGSNYSQILPPRTVIDAGDFISALELGKFIKQVANDKNRYIDYLKRKDNYIVTSKLTPVQEASCKLCEYLHTLDSHRKTYRNIFEWWMQKWRN